MVDFAQLRKQNIEETKQNIKKSVQFDNFIIQSIHTIDDGKRVSNILAKRLRDWYELYNPEFSREVLDHAKFVELIISDKDKKVKSSMGADLSKTDLAILKKMAKEVSSLYGFITEQERYLEKLMTTHCPNITAVAGFLIGAQLISLAGSLKRLVLFPASTVQILGAEKALFRHLKTGAKPPRHGVLVQHPLISSAPQKEHGKRARVLILKLIL